MDRKKFLKTAGIIFIISLILEIFVFNFRFFTCVGNEEREITPNDIILGSGFEYDPDNKWTVEPQGNPKPSFTVTDKKNAYIEIVDINEKVENIYIDNYNIKRKSYSDKKTVYKIEATDEANKLYFDLPERDVVCDVERSKYIHLNLSGKSEKLKINFKCNDGDIFVFNKLKINAEYPMFFSVIRLIITFAIILGIYIVRPKSDFYKYKFNLKSKRQKTVIGALIAVHIVAFIGIALLNPVFINTSIEHHKQYHQLTQALLDGHTYLDKEPSDALKNMENPYDSAYRNKVLKDAGERFLWDRAYFEGKYYVYFGIVPVFVFYMPFYLLTGLDFPTSVGIMITASVLIFAILGLVSQIIKRWFKDVPFLIYILLSFFFIDSCGIIYILKRPDFYSLPIIMGLTFSISGLYFWLSSMKYKKKVLKTNNTKKQEVDIENYEKLDVPNNTPQEEVDVFEGFIGWRLLVGSLCMALVAGCRPQMLVGSFLIIPLFWKIVIKDRMLFSKTSIKHSCYFMLPFVIVAMGLMYYNYIRFGSVFDFGANYNLTTNDMTKRDFVLGRTPLGIFTYLFQPPAYSPRFPFISDVWFYTNYMGCTINEYLFGGVIFNHFLLAINLFVFKFKNSLKLKGLLSFVIMSIAFAVIVVIADTQMAGLLQRYMTDFSWLLFIPAIILILILLERVNDYLRKHIYTLLICGLAFSFYYDFATIFFYGENTIYKTNPTIHYAVAHLVQFWL